VPGAGALPLVVEPACRSLPGARRWSGGAETIAPMSLISCPSIRMMNGRMRSSRIIRLPHASSPRILFAAQR
jgi:hypothetical protein